LSLANLAKPRRFTRSRAEAYNYPMDHSKLRVVERFASQVEADLAKSELESAGIDSIIQADRAGGMRDHLAWSGFGFKVLVREEDAADARDVLRRPDSELVLVQAVAMQDDADIAQGALLSAGIAATIQDDSAGARSPGAAWTGSGFRVLVRKEDVEKARSVLKRVSEGSTQSR